jgi:hypothetical protein
MNSIAALAHVATTAPPAFNGLFYATAATIIPVLFLAIAVQGPAYRKELHGIWLACLAIFKNPVRPRPLPRGFHILVYEMNKPRYALLTLLARLAIALVLALMLAFGIAIIAAAGYGELLAIYALYQAHDQDSTRHIVLIATMLLVILIVTGPLVTYLINALSPEPATQQPQPAAPVND